MVGHCQHDEYDTFSTGHCISYNSLFLLMLNFIHLWVQSCIDNSFLFLIDIVWNITFINVFNLDKNTYMIF